MVSAFSACAHRCLWHVRALGVNPLIRGSDRLEALAALAVLITAVVAIPVAAQARTEIYESGIVTANEQGHSRYSVDATVVEGSTRPPADFEGPAYIRVQWRDEAQVRTERVISPVTVEAGQPFELWLDDAGKVVPAPVTVDDAKTSALLSAAMLWLTFVACSLMAALLIRTGLDRYRDRAWERELHLLTHNDDGWASRHS